MREDSSRDTPVDCCIAISGGLDSMFALRGLLREGRKPLAIHLKWAHLKPHHKMENIAVEVLVDYLKEVGEFEYIEVPGPSEGGLDILRVARVVGPIMKERNIKEFICTTSKSDMAQRGWKERDARRRALFPEGTIFSYPSIGISKTEMRKDEDALLVGVAWSCRKPTPEGEACGKCHACVLT